MFNWYRTASNVFCHLGVLRTEHLNAIVASPTKAKRQEARNRAELMLDTLRHLVGELLECWPPPLMVPEGERLKKESEFRKTLLEFQAACEELVQRTGEAAQLIPDLQPGTNAIEYNQAVVAAQQEMFRYIEKVEANRQFLPSVKNRLWDLIQKINRQPPHQAAGLVEPADRQQEDASRNGSNAAVQPKKNRRKPPLRNAKRDEWIDKQRSKNTPWEKIYNELVRIAPSKNWSCPTSWKALSEAHARYMKRQRLQEK